MFSKYKTSVKQKSKKRKHKINRGETAWRVFGRTGNIIGKFSGDTAYKDVSAETAFLRYPYPAIAHTIAALEYMREMGVTYIDVLDTDGGIHCRTTVKKYFDEGEYFNGGAKYGDQLKLALPKFTQTRSAEYSNTDTDAPAYSEATETKPLHYRSRATVGVVKNGVQQMPLFRDGE
jgi:hypothetical protein